ncbi:TonB-dependent receptor domain-containing protein [Sphingomonas sp. C3-2]|uniref:TonB-dependent receptor domain-containing protein n=1 Tax=Sphingomonas sp. C3-2 TaxID=3062169 RepID=UPI00294B3E44|nr:TonB-dependent receptor [Sphingomonas sp. C3-2]WOK36810.1 TonB-dependent receptor [Sphingomonas sp. C3-2]
MIARTAKVVIAGLLGSASWTAVIAQTPANDGSGQDIVVTAAGYEQRIAEAPASISVLTREQLETRPFTSLEDAVRNIEGVSVVGDSPNSTDIVIRGMPGEYTLIMLDGRRQTTRETMNRGTGGVQANLIPPLAAIERIEVVRGPMSSLYGSDAMGGVVNIITRKVPEKLSGSVTLGGIAQEDGRYGNTTLGNFWIGAPIVSDTVGFQIYGGVNDRAEDDIFFPNSFTTGANRVRDRNINGKFTAIVAPGHDISLEGGYNRLSYTETPGRSTDIDSTRFVEHHRRNYQALTYNGDFGAAIARVAAFREQEKNETIDDGETLNEPNLVNWTVDSTVTLPMGTWNTMTIGGQYIHTKVKGIAGQDNVSGYVNTNVATRESWALFIEDQLKPVDGLIITGGARVDHYDQFGSHFTPRAYVNYTFQPGWTVRGGIARGFKAPTLRQSIADYCMSTGGGSLVRGPLCGNPDLEPEVSTTKEVGLRYDGAGKLGFGATLFHTNFKNKVVSFDSGLDDPVNPARPLYVYDNIDRVVIKGVELNGTLPIGPSVLLTANYTYTDSERRGGGEPAFDGSSLDGKPLDKTPEHMANIRLDWQATDKISAYALAYYTGRQYYSGFRNGAVRTREREASTTFDFGVNFTVTENFSLKAAVLNLTDKIVPIDDRGRFDGLDGNWMVDEGRRFWGTATFTF